MEATDTSMEAIVQGLIQTDEGNTSESDATEDETPEVADESEELEEDTEAEDAGEDADAEPDEDEDPDTSDDDPEEYDEEPEGPQTFTVKVDGEDVEVSLEDLQRSYSGDAFIQKGMRENAETRKALQADQQAVKQQRENLNALVERLQQDPNALMQPTPPPAEMADTDPIGYTRELAKYQESYQSWQANVAEVQREQAAQQDETNRILADYQREQESRLAETIPEFRSQETAMPYKRKLAEYAINSGVPQEAVAMIRDAATVQLLHKAFLYDQAQKAPKDKPKKKAKTVTPGAKATDAGKAKRATAKKRERLLKDRSMSAATQWLISE